MYYCIYIVQSNTARNANEWKNQATIVRKTREIRSIYKYIAVFCSFNSIWSIYKIKSHFKSEVASVRKQKHIKAETSV